MRILLALAALVCALASTPAYAQNVTCSTAPLGNSTNRCASTEFVQDAITAIPAVTPGGSNGQVQYNNAGAFGGLTNAQLTALCQQFTNLLSGCVPGSGGGTTNFLRADGAWAAPTGGLPPGTVVVTNAPFNATCDGIANDTSAIQSAINSGAKVVILPGICGVSGNLTGVSNQLLTGYGPTISGIKLLSALVSGDLLSYTGKAGFAIRDISIDYNNQPAPTAAGAIGVSGSNTFDISRINILRGTRIGITITGSTQFRVEDSIIARDSLVSTLNQAILITSSGGTNSYGRIQRNQFTNWGMLIGGLSACIIRENFINGYWYGAGIGAGDQDTCIIEANIITGGKNDLDADSTRPGGIENLGLKTIIGSNIIYDNGGAGIHSGGVYKVVSNNLTYNNGTYHLVNPAFEFAGLEARWADAASNGRYQVWSGNMSFDQVGTQSYGWRVVPSTGGANEPEYQNVTGNWFSGATAPMLYNSGIYASVWGPALEGSTGVGGATINTGSSSTFTLTVNGAALGDKVVAGPSVSLQGMSISGYVSAANTVQVVYSNASGSGVTFGAHTLRVQVIKASNAANY